MHLAIKSYEQTDAITVMIQLLKIKLKVILKY